MRFSLPFNPSKVKYNILIIRFLKDLISIFFAKNPECIMVSETLKDMITYAVG